MGVVYLQLFILNNVYKTSTGGHSGFQRATKKSAQTEEGTYYVIDVSKFVVQTLDEVPLQLP